MPDIVLIFAYFESCYICPTRAVFVALWTAGGGCVNRSQVAKLLQVVLILVKVFKP